jgi:hypothetical protein
MRTLRIALTVAAILTGLPATFCADTVAWGPVVNGMRLGIGLGTASSETRLRVLFQNVGATEQDLVISEDFDYLSFTVTAPEGKEYQVFDTRLLAAPPGPGLVIPVRRVVTHLNSGAMHEFRFSLRKLICVVDRRDVTLETLLQQRYSVRAHFEVDTTAASAAPHPWTGRMTSAQFLSRK